MIDVQIALSQDIQVDEAALVHAAQETVRQSGYTRDADLTIVLTSTEHIQELNRDYLGEDRPTDVLSFPEDLTDPDTGRPYLGDVIISYPQAQEQAMAAGHPVSEELLLLVVHGVLHLLGHDHTEPEEEERMWAIQASVLKTLGADSAARRTPGNVGGE
jgi:probable rRNA maturation factor